jgi:hypothetical protein
MIVDESAEGLLVHRRKNFSGKGFRTEPFQGGFADFIKYKSIQDALRVEDDPPRSSMFDDLCHYFKNHADLLRIDENPHSATVFLQKIIASHYMLLAEYNRALLSHLEWLLSRRETFAKLTLQWVEERWSDLQSFNRRCEEYHRDLKLIIRGNRIDRNIHNRSDWMDVSEDFLTLEEDFWDLKKKAEGLVSSYTGLASIVSSRHSLAEARGIRILTYLGMFFLPLSCVSGLFSMSEEYLPRAPKFWVYFAVALPLIVAVFGLAMLVGLVLESMGEDSFATWLTNLRGQALPHAFPVWVTTIWNQRSVSEQSTAVP